MTSKPVRIGFIGCGGHATHNIYPTFHLGVTGGSPSQPEPIGELIACCDLDPERARHNARAFGFERSYTDYRELLEKEELDCVFCVMHPRDQGRVALDVLDAGLPVFVEKPPTVSLEAAYALQAACERSGQFLMPAFMKRFSHPYQQALGVIRRPDFGPVVSFEARYNFGAYMAPEVYEFLNGFSCHIFDLSRFFMGEVESVYALYASPTRIGGADQLADYASMLDTRTPSTPQEEAWLIGLTFESGAVGFLQTNCLERVQERVFLTGQGSWVAVDDWRRVTAFLPSEDTPFSWDPYERAHPHLWEPYDQLPTDTQDLRTVHGYTGEVRHFIECVRDKRIPTPNINDGIAHLKIEFAAKRSAREKRPVTIAEIG